MRNKNSVLPISIVIRAGNDFKGLLKCINSIDESVEIVASVSENVNFISKIRRLNKNLVIAKHPYGNWSIAAENGIKSSRYNNLIIMDSDSFFGKRAIKHIHEALNANHLIVQSQIEFLTGTSWISKIISRSRSFENRYEAKAYSPGLGLKRKELIKQISVDGSIYQQKVFYADDGNINKRAKDKNIEIFVEPNATIYHDPTSLKHEIITAFRLGRGNRQGQVKTRSFLYPVVKGFMTKKVCKYYLNALVTYGLATMLFLIFWRFIYILGYYKESLTPKIYEK